MRVRPVAGARHGAPEPACCVRQDFRLLGSPPLRGRYRTSSGTTLMLLNGEPLISFVLTTVYTSTCFSASMARWIWKLLKNSDADAKPITSDRGRLAGMLTGPTARQAIENRLGSSAIPMPPLIPPVSARDM